MSKKTPDCFKLLNLDCINKLENLFESKKSNIPTNNNIGSKNIIKNDNQQVLPPPPPPPLPSSLRQKNNITKNNDNEDSYKQDDNKQDDNKQNENIPNDYKQNENKLNYEIKENNYLSMDKIYNLRHKLPLQIKLEKIGEAILDNHLQNVKNKPINLQLPEWLIGVIAGTITTTFFNVLYYRFFG